MHTSPPIPLNETVRLISRHALRILDSAPEERFDRITRLAKKLFDVDICLVSLVDTDRQGSKSKQGLDACDSSREKSFCGHAITDDQAFVVEDAREDERFSDNPLVRGDPGLRFYAGYPVHSPDGQHVGTLCLIDKTPRQFSASDKETLKDFAALVNDEFASATEMNVDVLTNIANRRGFQMVAQHLLPLCARNDLSVQLLYFDLDGFKALNDEYGHEKGDEALKYFAKLLLKNFRSADVVARLGGDEFAVIVVCDSKQIDSALSRMKTLAKNTDDKISKKLKWSVGHVEFVTEFHDDIACLLKDADARMFANKARKRQNQDRSDCQKISM